MRRSEVQQLVRVSHAEVERAFRSIHLPGHPRPYYLSHLIRDERIWRIRARFGALQQDEHVHRRDCLADVRVGSYRSDQVLDGGLQEDDHKELESYECVEIPIGSRAEGIRHALWRLTEARYREAADGFLQKRASELTYLDRNRNLRAFERREAHVDLRWEGFPEIDVDAWRRLVERVSAQFRRYPLLKNGHAEFSARHLTRIFTSSEGTRLVEASPYCSLELYFWFLSPRGDALPLTRSFFFRDPAELPDERRCRRLVREGHALLERLAAAPRIHAFSGPVLLDPVPAGLLVHEAIGHRLEGARLLSAGEGQTFRDSIGQRVLPVELSLHDDPRQSEFEGKSLVGHYRYDDEGVPAQDAQLITGGVLRGFLSSRTPIQRRHSSNGHGRSRFHQRPMSRMGVTIVEAQDGLDPAAMRAAFLAEIRRQGVPYGIRIIEASGGETATGSYDFQAFLGDITVAARVYPDGREELVRGVDFVGTPLNAIRNIVAAGNDPQVDNAVCGAESGYVPVSTICPSLLLKELELQSKSETPYTQFVYPLPWESNGRARARR